jgi:hypothetical protein
LSGSTFRPAAEIAAFEGLAIAHEGNHAQELSTMMCAVRDKVEYLMQTSVLSQ